MLLDLTALRKTSEDVPAFWRGFVERAGTGFVVRGDRTARREIFLSTFGGVALVADQLGELLDRLSERQRPALNPFGVSSLLHHGLISPPFSEYEDVLALTIGDSIEVSWLNDLPVVRSDCEYPWFADNSRQDETPSTRHLLDLLTEATAGDVAAAGGDGFLMLSSGKDSAAVALALAEAGITGIPCVTYSSGPDDPEPRVAAGICRRLGLEHRVVELPRDPVRVRAALTHFFERSPAAGADLAQVPYALAAFESGSPGGVLLDGGGNDSYMGFPVTGRWTAKTRLRIRGRLLREIVQQRTPVDSPLNYLARSRIETAVSGRMMRYHESRQFYPEAVDTRPHWASLSRNTAHLSMFDVYAIMERYITPPSSMKKHVLAAHATGHEPAIPWCHHEVADYYFNLPEPHRYDKRRGINKLLLRDMLVDYLDYDAASVGKHYFAFDGPRFIAENMEFVRSEIAACRLWDQNGMRVVHGWLDSIESRPLLYHPLLTLFMVSGWHNHSRFVGARSRAGHGAASG